MSDTFFNDNLNNKSEYKTIDLNEWTLTGAGANSKSYTSKDGNLMLKVFKFNGSEEIALKDYYTAKNVMDFGLVTPKVYEIVKVGDGFGVIYQNLKNKKSYSRLIADDPDHIEEYARNFARKSKELHSTPCNTELFDSRLSVIRKGVERAKFIRKHKENIYKFLDSIDSITTCVHGDLQTGNLVRADGVDYWIDLDRFSYGDPIIEIAHMYTVYVGMSWFPYIHSIFHLNKKQLNKFWDVFIEEYYGFSTKNTEKYAKLLDTIKKYNCLDLVAKNCYQPGLTADLVTLTLVLPKLRRYFN